MSNLAVGKAESSSHPFFSEPIANMERTFHHYIPKIPQYAEFAWDRFKTLFIGESKETLYLKELTSLEVINWNEEETSIANILSQANPYGIQGHLLKGILKRCDDKALKNILLLSFEHLFEASNEDYLKLLNFIGTKVLKQSPGNATLLEEVQELAACMPNNPISEKQSIGSELRKTFNVVWRFFPNFMDTILKAFNLIEAGKGPESVWDFAAMMEIYFKIFMIPQGIFVIVGAAVDVAWQLFLITGLIVLGGVIGICLYLKYRPCPNQLARARNLTDEAKLGKLEPVIGRDQEIQKIGSYLGKAKDGIYTNILLVGEPGVGKTELVKGLAQKIKEKTIFAINAPELSSGYNSPADIMRLMLLDIKGHEKEVVFFFDELGESMKKNGKANLTGYLKPLLASDGVQVIAALTKYEYEEVLAKDKAFCERFTKIEVKPTSKEVTLEILQERMRLKGGGIKFQPGLAEAIYTKTENMLQPRNSVKLLDLAINHVSAFDISLFVPKKLQEANAALKEKQLEYEKAHKSGKSEKKLIAQKIYDLQEAVRLESEKSQKMTESAMKTKALIALERTFSEKRDQLAREQSSCKELLFLHALLLPWMEKKALKLLESIEEIPMQIDESLIQQLVDQGNLGDALNP